MPSSDAVARFLAATELVEHTLSYLSPTDLLRCEAVSRFFRALITTSIHLQRALFLRPTPPPPSADPAHNSRRLNPLLARHFPFFFTAHEEATLEVFKTSHPWAQDAQRRDAFTRREASWRRMLVAQPPLPHLYLKQGESPGKVSQGQLQFPVCWQGTTGDTGELGGGLRMGPLFDVTVELVRYDHVVCYWVKKLWTDARGKSHFDPRAVGHVERLTVLVWFVPAAVGVGAENAAVKGLVGECGEGHELLKEAFKDAPWEKCGRRN